MGYRREIAAKNRKFAFDPKQSAVRAGRASLFVRSFLQPGEIYAFLIITAVVMPFVAVATVGTWGLTVWIYQAINGPPGPPSK